MKILKIQVTQKDIDKAKCEIKKTQMYEKCCPVAQALKRTIFDNKDVCADVIDISPIHPLMPRRYINLSDKIRKFISAFDKGDKVKPITFHLKYDEHLLT